MVRAIILVKSPKKLISVKLGKLASVENSFPTSGQFDAVAIIDVKELREIKDVTNQIQKIKENNRIKTNKDLNKTKY